MKRIGLLLQSSPPQGGVYQYSLSVLEALCALPRDEFTPFVLYANEDWTSRLASLDCEYSMAQKKPLLLHAMGYLWRYSGLSIHLWRMRLGRMGKFNKALIRADCDFWIFPVTESDTFMTSVNSVAVVHDLMHRYERRFPEVSAGGEYRRREIRFRSICATANGVLVDSETGKQQLVESYNYDSAKTHVLPFVPPTYIKSKFPPIALDEYYALPDKYIFYPAQFWKHKNHEALIQAAARAIQIVPDIHLVFVGTKKNNYQTCLRLVRDLDLSNSVTFLGFVPDEHMPDLYRQARAMVMPTFFGPTNIPPLEAFALGCPVAISDVYGIREQVGDAALLFDPNDIDELEQVLVRLWTDAELCRNLTQNGLRKTKGWGQQQFNNRFLEIMRAV